MRRLCGPGEFMTEMFTLRGTRKVGNHCPDFALSVNGVFSVLREMKGYCALDRRRVNVTHHFIEMDFALVVIDDELRVSRDFDHVIEVEVNVTTWSPGLIRSTGA